MVDYENSWLLQQYMRTNIDEPYHSLVETNRRQTKCIPILFFCRVFKSNFKNSSDKQVSLMSQIMSQLRPVHNTEWKPDKLNLVKKRYFKRLSQFNTN